MAEETMLYVPEPLQELILVRLPVKSILRFESVCKRWLSLFHSKAFVDLHFGFDHEQVPTVSERDLCKIYPELRRGVRKKYKRGKRSLTSAIGPLSNGIYALVSVLEPPYKKFQRVLLHTIKIALFNPATRSLKFAAPFPDEYLLLLTGVSSHRCDVSYGLDDDYRVVVLINYEIDSSRNYKPCYLVFLYTWRTGEWERLVDYRPGRKKIGLPPSPHVFEQTITVWKNMMACPQKLFNGCWHWMTTEFDEEELGEWFGVLSFNFVSKSLRLIPGPPFLSYNRGDVFVLQDHLASILYDYDGLEHRLQIWMKMRDLETTWNNVFSVNYTVHFRPFWISEFCGVDYYQEEEQELIKVRSITFVNYYEYRRVTFDDKGHQVVEDIDPSKEISKISLSVGRVSTFRPTLERLPL